MFDVKMGAIVALEPKMRLEMTISEKISAFIPKIQRSFIKHVCQAHKSCV